MGKFSLNDILSERSKAQDMQSEEIRTDGMVELIDIYDMIPSQDNFYDVTRHMDLVNSIKLLGVLQPVLLTESEEPDKYSIKAGHRRREACLYLVEQEGLEKFRYIPSIIKPEQEETMSKLTIIMANRFRDKTDWEKMQEVIQTEELLAEMKGNKNLGKQMRAQLKEKLGIENDQNMKTRDFVAEILGTSATQVGRYNAIYKKLCWECMEIFKRGIINVSVAYEIAGLSPEWQEKAFKIINDDGAIQISDIKKLKQQEEASKPLTGQMKLSEVKLSKVLPLTEENKECAIRYIFEECHSKSFPQEEMEKLIDLFSKGEDGHNGYLSQQMLLEQQLPFENDNVRLSMNCGYRIEFIHTEETITIPVYIFWRTFEYVYGWKWESKKQEDEVEEPEQFEAKPEYKDVLCYSCLHYDECDQKAGTVFACSTYKNKAQAEKTSEQLYSEEQDRIDRETAKKIEEMKQKDIEEKSLPSGDKREPRDDFEITVTMRQYSEVYYGHINFLVTPKKDYRFDDTITLKEYRQGEPTGKEITVKVKNVVQDCTGIEDKYCVIGFYTVQK